MQSWLCNAATFWVAFKALFQLLQFALILFFLPARKGSSPKRTLLKSTGGCCCHVLTVLEIGFLCEARRAQEASLPWKIENMAPLFFWNLSNNLMVKLLCLSMVSCVGNTITTSPTQKKVNGSNSSMQIGFGNHWRVDFFCLESAYSSLYVYSLLTSVCWTAKVVDFYCSQI